MRSFLEGRGLSAYEDFVDCTDGEAVSSRGSARTRRIPVSSNSNTDECLYLKVYRYEPLSWRTSLMRDKCSIEFQNYLSMRDACGIPVPEVMAIGVRRSIRRLRDAFIVTRGVPAARPLDEWWDCVGRKDRAAAAWALQESARLVAAMHERGFSHIDLQWRNILVSRSDSGESKLYLLDSTRGGMRSWSVRREHGRIRDLSSLAKGAVGRLTRTDQLRWLCRYFGIRRMGVEHRALVGTILRDRQLKDGDAR